MKRTGNFDVHKDRYYHQPKALIEKVQATSCGTATRKRKKITFLAMTFLKKLANSKIYFFHKKGFNESIPRGKSKTIQSSHHPPL